MAPHMDLSHLTQLLIACSELIFEADNLSLPEEKLGISAFKDDRVWVSAEDHCVARDVVNIIACEGGELVERHELFGKWRLRLKMAGFNPVRLSSLVNETVKEMLKEYSSNYRVAEGNGTLFLGWKNRALVTSSAWR